jgi:hypothetical protein
MKETEEKPEKEMHEGIRKKPILRPRMKPW